MTYPNPEAHDYELKTYDDIECKLRVALDEIKAIQTIVSLDVNTSSPHSTRYAEASAYLQTLNAEHARITLALEAVENYGKDTEGCESCMKPAMQRSADDVPLCGDCLDALTADQRAVFALMSQERYRQQTTYGYTDDSDDKHTRDLWQQILELRMYTIKTSRDYEPARWPRRILELATICLAILLSEGRKATKNETSDTTKP